MGNEANKTMINIVAMSRGPIVKIDMELSSNEELDKDSSEE